MATFTNRDNRLPRRANATKRQTEIKCAQLNLQHSKTATYNLTQLILHNNIDVAFVQEPYIVLNNVAGFPKSFRICAHGNGRKRSAIIVNNNKIDAIAIRQVSDEDATLIELSYSGLNFYGASLYFPIDREIERDIELLEEIMQLTKGKGLLLSIDSNSRSKLWYDTITNQRGKLLEDFIITRDLILMNVDTSSPTFETIRGRSWIDLTLCNSILAQKTSGWTCGDEESCADHKIIFFNMVAERSNGNAVHYPGKRYLTKTGDWGKFVNKLTTNLLLNFRCLISPNDPTKCDEELSNKVKQFTDLGETMHKFISAVAAASDAAFRVSRASDRALKKRSVPWWTGELTLLRKKALALRRRYQRTRNDVNLRHERRLQYQIGNRHYQTKLRQEKLKSWKEFCSRTENSNPWNAVYRLATGKLQHKTTLSTLKTRNDIFTTDIESTFNQMMEYFIPEDSESTDGVHHTGIRQQTMEPLNTIDDVEFTKQEILAVLEKFDPSKAPGEDGLSSDILLQTFRCFPNFFTEIYNECLRRGYFPTQWKRSIIIPIVKPGKEGSMEASKYRPISLLNVGGKVLEKLLIDRINHHIFSHSLLNGNQYGFLPQKSTVDAAMAVKGFVRENLQQRNYVVMVSLDVKGAFDAAWWPSILSNLRDLRCPKNLYTLTQNYFSDRIAIFYANTYTVERKVSMGCPQGSCCGPGLWNVMYNALLNLDFSGHTKVIAFADDLVIMTQGKTPSEAEVYSNSDMSRIGKWTKENKMQFNEFKSKAMLISRKRSNDNINIYLNNRRLEQVKELST